MVKPFNYIIALLSLLKGYKRLNLLVVLLHCIPVESIQMVKPFSCIIALLSLLKGYKR